MSRPDRQADDTRHESGEDSEPRRYEDEDLEICDPGDLLCAEQPETRPSEESQSKDEGGLSKPPSALRKSGEGEEERDSSEESRPSIQKLSEEQLNNIRSNLLKDKTETESEFVTAENASSIKQILSGSGYGQTLQGNETETPASEDSNLQRNETETPSSEDSNLQRNETETPSSEGPTLQKEETETPSSEGPTIQKDETEPPSSEGPTLRRNETEPPSSEGPTLRRNETEIPSREGPTLQRNKTEIPSREGPILQRNKTEIPSREGPILQRKKIDPPEKTGGKRDYSSSLSSPGFTNDTSSATHPMSTPTSAPSRRVAYFHKKFIQLTGPVHPANGEEMVIMDRHYLLKPKKIKPQYTIGIASVLAILLLFLIGKQFVSPTLPGSGAIIGVILDQNGRPLVGGAEISLPETGKKVRSDAAGFFRFDNVPTGIYNIRYTLPDGRVGSEDISVANDEITTLSLSTAGATERYSRRNGSTGDNGRSSLNFGRRGDPRSMPPIPDEKRQEGDQTANSSLQLAANVNNAKLIVNGQVLGTGNLTYRNLAPGKHKAKVTKAGYKAWSGNIWLEPNETYTLSVDLEKSQVADAEQTYSADDFYQSGRTMFADGNIDAAVQDFTEAINMKPSMADAYVARAQAYAAGSKTILAENDYIRAGEIYTTQKRNESALGCFRKAIDINPRSVAALLNRGDLYKKLDAKEKALGDYKDAVKYDKENFRANFELGKMYFSMGKHKDADKRLRIARDLDPGVPQVYHYMMLNYFARDDFGKVKSTYGEFKDNVSPDQQQAFKDNPRFNAILRVVGEYERP